MKKASRIKKIYKVCIQKNKINISLRDNTNTHTHTPAAGSVCSTLIGLMDEHITSPIRSGMHTVSIYKHALMCPFISHLIIKHINRVCVY